MRLVVFGEGMVERRADGATAYGGDALNTAIYLARQGARPELMTAMGADSDSDRLVDAWAGEGVDVGHVLRDADRRPGAYAIQLRSDGERSFTYDRDQSAARHFFHHPQAEATLAWAAEADLLYLTGITLSIFQPEERRRIVELARTLRARGGQVAFDPNYRPAGWSSAQAAWAAIGEIAPAVTLAMPSAEDHARLCDEATPAQIAAAWRDLGAQEVVVKLGAAGAHVETAGESVDVAAAPPQRVVDATAAGDAFNAAYLAARVCRGASIRAAGEAGAALAGEVIAWPGAIAPAAVGRLAPAR